MIENENSNIHSPASLLQKDSQISTNRSEKNTFVVYGGQVAVGGSRTNHSDAALQNDMIYPETKHSRRPQVDDGGLIYDDGDRLVIASYFTKSTWPKYLYEALMSEKSVNLSEVRKEIRSKTGQLIANITNRNVLVEHKDKTCDSFSPQQ